MKAIGAIRRIDDLGRAVIPKEIRRIGTFVSQTNKMHKSYCQNVGRFIVYCGITMQPKAAYSPKK